MQDNDIIDCCIGKGICNDNFIGTIENVNSKLNFSIIKRKRFIERNSIDDIINNGYKNIIIVLESPHNSEYEEENFISPAIGKTGELLQKYFHECIKDHLSSNENYNVILMNAIQYQCSLGVSPIENRDKIWCDLWFNHNKKDDFIERLKHYKPDIVITACTTGIHIVKETNKKQLPNLKYINNIIQSPSVYQATIEKLKKLKFKYKYSLKGYVEIEIINTMFEKDVKLLYISHPSS